ncbi:hypothetical protein ES703_82930 [subsurface metagenome]
MTLANNSSGVKAQEFANETKMTHIFSEYFENIIDWYVYDYQSIMINKPPPTVTAGERFFFNRLEHFLESYHNIYVYFEPNISGLHPDFLILSPNFGIIIVEIKDYSPRKLLKITKSGKWEKLEGEKTISIENPFDQIYQYWRAVKNSVNNCHFPDHVQIPIIRIVAFSQISKQGNTADNIFQISPRKIHLCFKESLMRNLNFLEFIKDIIPSYFYLQKKYFNILRANLIPTCRLPIYKESLRKFYTIEDKVKLLDLEQEKLAKKLGDGHRLIFGVAGSGKTILLIARARYLVLKHPNWKILIICFNRLLRNLIFNLLNPQDFEADITVSTFHAWIRHYILSSNNGFTKIYLKAEEKAEKEGKFQEFFQDVSPKLFLKMVQTSGSNRVFYDAILIDEAQDFEADWFKGIIKVINPNSNSLLITCDGLQGIYARKKFYWSDVGIHARGRVKKFDKSYRVPIEIGVLAQKSLPNTLQDLLDKYDEFISTKQFAGEHGIVEIMVSNSYNEEYEKLANKTLQLLQNPQEILILFKKNMAKINYKHLFFNVLKKLNIEWEDLKNHNYGSPGLLIGTIHGTKGLECDTIIIPEVNTYLSNIDRQLLYVAMTRSRKKLIFNMNFSFSF